MCWSAPVSGVFAALQAASIIYLIVRNQHYDRFYAVFAFPVMAQEFFQMMIWLDRDGKEESTCSTTWSIFCLVFQRGVIAIFCSTSFGMCRRSSLWRKSALAVLCVIAIAGWITDVVLWTGWGTCTLQGKCHHLVLGSHGKDPSDVDSRRVLLWFLTYFFPMLMLLVLVKIDDLRGFTCRGKTWFPGKWAPGGVFAVGGSTLAAVYVYYNFIMRDVCTRGEWGSVW